MTTPKQALLIVDHGSRNAEANAAIADLARRVAEHRPDWRVAHAHMEIAQPDVLTVIDALVAEGVTTVHLHLHFLGRGYHVRETIPELVAAASERHERLSIHVGDPIGEDPRLVEIVVERMERGTG